MSVFCSLASRAKPAKTLQRPDVILQPTGETSLQRLSESHCSLWAQPHADHGRGA